MTQAIKRFTRLDNMREAVSEIRKNGVVVIENLFEPDLMNTLFNHLRPSLDSQKPGAEIFLGIASAQSTAYLAGVESLVSICS